MLSMLNWAQPPIWPIPPPATIVRIHIVRSLYAARHQHSSPTIPLLTQDYLSVSGDCKFIFLGVARNLTQGVSKKS